MTLESETESETAPSSFPGALAHFFAAPIRLRTYSNLLYLLLAFPLGLFYFVFLSVGLAVGYGLTVVWIGFPILALVFAGSWWMSVLERRLAIGLLGAEVPPMTSPASAAVVGFWARLQTFLSNPVTWKGMGFLLMKFPLGVASFVALVTTLSISLSLLIVPVVWPFGDVTFDVDFGVWQPSSFAGALLCGLAGAIFLFLSLNLLNALAYAWRLAAASMLGSSRFSVVPPPPAVSGMPGTPAMPGEPAQTAV